MARHDEPSLTSIFLPSSKICTYRVKIYTGSASARIKNKKNMLLYLPRYVLSVLCLCQKQAVTCTSLLPKRFLEPLLLASFSRTSPVLSWLTGGSCLIVCLSVCPRADPNKLSFKTTNQRQSPFRSFTFPSCSSFGHACSWYLVVKNVCSASHWAAGK
jgi:hypothetical protein